MGWGGWGYSQNAGVLVALVYIVEKLAELNYHDFELKNILLYDTRNKHSEILIRLIKLALNKRSIARP